MNTTEKTKKFLNKKKTGKPTLNPKNELFCKYYSGQYGSECFYNGVMSYAHAYGYNLEDLSKVNERAEDGRELPRTSDYDRAYSVCGVSAFQLLKIPKIQEKIRDLLVESLNDRTVDAELAKVLAQDGKLDSKMSAIKEYNKLRQRIVDKLDHTSNGQPIQIQISEVIAQKNGLK